MTCLVYLWVVLVAGVVTVSGIGVDVLDTILSWNTTCSSSQSLEDSSLFHVECVGLGGLSDVSLLVDKDVGPRVASLTITHSYLTINPKLDDLKDFPSLHTLTLKKSRLMEWEKSNKLSHPRVKKLVVEQCWDNNTFLAEPKQLTLRFSTKWQDAFPDLKELYLSGIYMPLIAEPTALKNLVSFVIKDGAVKCEAGNLWVLEWFNAGKLDIISTVCFIKDMSKEGLGSINIQYTFFKQKVMQTLKIVKSTVEDCPASCTCDVNGFRDETPLTFVNCSSANLTQLPSLIPSHTKRLYLSNNHITNISRLFVDPIYHNLDLILLDNNLIRHIDGDLLYSYLKHRSLDFKMSLANNKLETLPLNHFEKMYEESTQYIPTFVLTGNPWNCDNCVFIVPFQRFLSKFYKYQHSDSMKEIRCGPGSSEDKQILKLSVKSYCKEEPLLEPLDILNICLGVLLFLFILNFIHNLVQYQRHGKLPWIVNKFPM